MIGFTSNPEPFSCGGLKNYFGDKDSFDKPAFLIHFISNSAKTIMFQDKSYLRAVLVAVCIPLLCDNAFRYSDKSGSSTCRSRSWCHRCCPQF